MFSRFSAAFGLLFDPPIRRILILSLIGASGLLVVLAAGLGAALFSTALTGWGWLDDLLAGFGVAAALAGAWVLFPPLAGVIVGFFLDAVAGHAEAKYIPGLSPPRNSPVSEAVMIALKYAGLVLAVNLLLLPALLLGPFYPVLYYLANGYLLGREYFDLTAARRLTPDQATHWRRGRRGLLLMHGLAVAFLFSLPLINLVTPIIATGALALLVAGIARDLNGHDAGGAVRPPSPQ